MEFFFVGTETVFFTGAITVPSSSRKFETTTFFGFRGRVSWACPPSPPASYHCTIHASESSAFLISVRTRLDGLRVTKELDPGSVPLCASPIVAISGLLYSYPRCTVCAYLQPPLCG